MSGLDLYFAMARGTTGISALDMTKFFDTNYHYIVPELAVDFATQPTFDMFLDKVSRGQQAVGLAAAVPIVLGECRCCGLYLLYSMDGGRIHCMFGLCAA